MSGLLYGVGVLAVVVGAVMIGFGIPINEFSFGNTLIGAGVTAAVGGLVIIGLGVVVSQLRRLNDSLSVRAPVRPGRPLDMFDTTGGHSAPAPARIPFPPKPKADAEQHEPSAYEPQVEAPASTDTSAKEPQPVPPFAPMLRNPEEAPVTVEEDVSLSPAHPAAIARAPGFGPPPAPPRVGDVAHPKKQTQFEPKFDADWRSPAPGAPPTRQPTYFDAMWPAEPKPAKSPVAADTKPTAEAKPSVPTPRRAEPEAPIQHPASESRGVAILKSGVVDGMGYTLYVDGSIEAELPQGTLRFSSINELRSHLEKNS